VEPYGGPAIVHAGTPLPPITSFQGDHAFLSNFFESPVQLDGLVALTAEHLFQALKTLDPDGRAWVLSSPTPAVAKARWRAQDSVDTPARALVSGFELLRADAAKVAVPA
jgi:predicted NAD-dependent protein-ADP-ribosyltransferase YbiA (DUF1768 family)